MAPAAASLSQTFSSCTFAPCSADGISSTPIVTNGDGSWSTTSYYLDSSGRSKFILTLQLGCQSKEDLDQLVSSGCIHPLPQGCECEVPVQDSPLLKFEVKSHTTNEDKAVAVEGIAVLSCQVTGNSLLFETEVVVRAASPSRRRSSAGVSRVSSRLSSSSSKYGKSPSLISAASISSVSGGAFDEKSLCSTLLEITAILSHRKKTSNKQTVSPGILALELGGGTLPGDVNHPSHGGTLQTKLEPALLNLELTPALALSVKNVAGSSGGKTLVSLTIKHSNTHSFPVTVTNVALHPGHSRQEPGRRKDRSMPGGQQYVTDMSKFVQWGYAPQTELTLPLTLYPHDAYSTVLMIDAGEDLRSRSFLSPVSITAVVGDADEDREASFGHQPCVVATADCEWITGRVAVEPADAFRVDMTLKESCCHVGGQVLVSLAVTNLSTEARDLMLLMAKDDDRKSSKPGSVNTAVVSEVNGYTFGVWGLSTGDDDGTTRHNRDHELLAVDAALLLGEVKGQHSVEAELRFVPLREGTLDVPNFKLYDKIHGKWYNCVHMLKIVAASKKEQHSVPA